MAKARTTTDRRVIVQVELFDRFEVIVDGVRTGDAAWSRRSAAALTKLLALTPGRRLHREQVIDALWPDTPVGLATPRLHKAAHYARRALGVERSLVLHNDMVMLLPDAEVVVDVLELCRDAEAALRNGSAEEARRALARFGGEPLPENLYDTWADEVRTRVSGLREELRRRLAVDPSASSVTGDRTNPAVPRRSGDGPLSLTGRGAVGDALGNRFDRTERGSGGTLILSGPPGVGKTAVLEAAIGIASRRGWSVGRATASALEAPWPYASASDALLALCDARPAPPLASRGGPGQERLPSEGAQAAEGLRHLLQRGAGVDDEAFRARVFPAVERLLRSFSVQRPVLIVVDDVDEADLGSLRLLHYVARRVTGSRVLLLIAHRTPASAACARLRDSLLARDLAQPLALSPRRTAAVAPGHGHASRWGSASVRHRSGWFSTHCCASRRPNSAAIAKKSGSNIR